MIIDSSSMACGMAYGSTSRSTVARSMVFVLFFSLVSWTCQGLTSRGDGVESDEVAEVTAPHARLGWPWPWSVWAVAWGVQSWCYRPAVDARRTRRGCGLRAASGLGECRRKLTPCDTTRARKLAEADAALGVVAAQRAPGGTLQARLSAVGEPVSHAGAQWPSTPGWRSTVNNNFKAADRQNSQQSFPPPWLARRRLS